MNAPWVLGITGASGAVYAIRLLEVLLAAGRSVHVSVSPSGQAVLAHELQRVVSLDAFQRRQLLPAGDQLPGELIYHHHRDMMSPIASGSFLTAGMVICPCSGGTLSAVAHGQSGNLVQRAADVHLKERRKLILVPRETPLSAIHLNNMLAVHQAGAVVLPAAPGWYHEVQSLDDLVNFIVARILDQMGLGHDLIQRWGSGREASLGSPA